MPSYLVWPDIHNRVDLLNRFLERNGDQYERRYFLGDYFDQFNDTVFDAEKTALCVKKLLEDPRNILGLGNHDLSYMFPWNKHVWCPGFSPKKAVRINSILTPEDWRKMKLAYYVDGWLISHAGVKAYNFGSSYAKPEFTVEDVLTECDKALQKCEVGDWHFLVMAGADRGGRSFKYGGIDWLDWGCFDPIKGINQIVGHTILPFPGVKVLKDDGTLIHRSIVKDWGEVMNSKSFVSTNFCLDTNNAHFGVLEDGIMHVYPTIEFL